MTLYVAGVVIYAVTGISTGAVMWHYTRGTWASGSLAAHVTRCVLMTVVVGLCWPMALIVAFAYLFELPAQIIDRLIFGSKSGGGEDCS